MRILANENVPGETVDALREGGHDISWVRAECPGISDRQVITKAIDEERILLTFDKDFGELVFRLGYPVLGVILFRIATPSSSYVTQFVKVALENRSNWEGHFSVIDEKRIRMTPIPKRK
jgi:predicted nuclease of predicted toxin-antitoxin system